MAAPFAAIETATASGVIAALANATATIGAVSNIEVIFDDGYRPALDGVVEASAPQLTCDDADIAHVALGMAVTVNAASYSVISIQPDGTGMTVLILEEA